MSRLLARLLAVVLLLAGLHPVAALPERGREAACGDAAAGEARRHGDWGWPAALVPAALGPAAPGSAFSDVVALDATGAHRIASPASSRVLIAFNGVRRLDQLNADTSYGFAATWTPTIQRYRTGEAAEADMLGNGADPPAPAEIAAVARLDAAAEPQCTVPSGADPRAMAPARDRR